MKPRKRFSPSNLRWLFVIVSCLAAAAAFSLRPTMAQITNQGAANQNTIPGHPPQLVLDGTAQLAGPFASSQKLRLVIGLLPPNMAEEEKFLEDVQNRNSPQFHRFLTADQWNQRFAPSVKDEQAVVDWAKSQGFTVTNRYPNRLLVDVEAPVSVIQTALGVNINSYKVNSETFFSNNQPPSIPPALSGIVHSVEGLNNLERMHGSMKGAGNIILPVYVPGPVVAQGESVHSDGDPSKLPASMASLRKGASHGSDITSLPNITNGLYDPSDIYGSNAYDYNALQALGHCCNPLGNSGSSPPESSIALATYGDVNFTDVAGFHTQYPYLAYNIQKISIDGGPPACVVSPTNGCGNNAETTLDTEWSLATSNDFGGYGNTAKIWVYESSGSATDMYNQMLTDGHARVFSTSWSCTEFYGCSSSTMDTRHAIFNSMIGQGWTLMTASGDRGATDDCAHESVSYPASDPDVVGVGGTLLRLFSDSTYDSEAGWTGGTYAGACSQNNGGSGGGCSSYYSAPGFQSNQPCGSGSRAVPDISLNAAGGQNYYFNGSLQGVGGTSISSPEMAGFFAQVNAYLLYIGSITGNSCGSFHRSCSPIGNGNSYLYYFGLHPSYAPHYPYYDITSGCNSNDITAEFGLGYYCAGIGDDQVTGWGTSNMLQLAWAINTYIGGDFGAPSVAFSGPATGKWYNTDQTVNWTVTDTSANGANPNGVAGFSQAWDSDPGNVFSEPTPGQGNSFYSGPEFPNATSGYLNLAGAGSQGCHTVNVRTWDNSGVSANSTYGSLCYDTVAPVTTASLSGTLSGGNYVNSVKVTLSATDNSSGVAATYYQIDGGATHTYAAPFSVTGNGVHKVNFHSVDIAGNTETSKLSTFTVKGSIAVTVVSSQNPAPFDSAVIFTATVVPGDSGTPTGTVTFKDSATTLATAPLSGGKAALSTSTLSGGVHSITAAYSGDVNFIAQTSTALSQTITKRATVTALTGTPNPSGFTQAVTFTASVTSAVGVPGGSVVFKDGVASLATVALTAGKAILTDTSLTGGSHSITAAYSGNVDYNPSTSAALSHTVTKAATKIALVASLNPSAFDQPVTFTATVTPTTSGAATGTVTFRDGATGLGSPALAGGKAILTVSTLAVGSHSITAAYNGNVDYNPITSAALAHTVGKAATKITLVASLNPSAFDQSVTFTATVTPTTSGAATGTVTFRDGATGLGSPALAGGKAILTVSTLAVGSHSITAAYNGNVDYNPITSAALAHTVNKAATSTALVSSLNPSTFNQSVTFTATVTPTTSGVATGTVTFRDGTTGLGSPALAGGKAALTVSTLAVGGHSITAAYNGSADYTLSTSAVLTQVVK